MAAPTAKRVGFGVHSEFAQFRFLKVQNSTFFWKTPKSTHDLEINSKSTHFPNLPTRFLQFKPTFFFSFMIKLDKSIQSNKPHNWWVLHNLFSSYFALEPCASPHSSCCLGEAFHFSGVCSILLLISGIHEIQACHHRRWYDFRGLV